MQIVEYRASSISGIGNFNIATRSRMSICAQTHRKTGKEAQENAVNGGRQRGEGGRYQEKRDCGTYGN